jgi:hypothetical protein
LGDVARQLTDAAMLFSNVLDRLTAGDWDRTLVYKYPQPRQRPLAWPAIHTVHDVQHASLDVAHRPSIAQTMKAYVGGTIGASASIAKLLLIKPFRR